MLESKSLGKIKLLFILLQNESFKYDSSVRLFGILDISDHKLLRRSIFPIRREVIGMSTLNFEF